MTCLTCLWKLLASLQQIFDLNAEAARQRMHVVDGDIASTSFDLPDVAPAQAAAVGKFLKAESLALPFGPKLRGEFEAGRAGLCRDRIFARSGHMVSLFGWAVKCQVLEIL